MSLVQIERHSLIFPFIYWTEVYSSNYVQNKPSSQAMTTTTTRYNRRNEEHKGLWSDEQDVRRLKFETTDRKRERKIGANVEEREGQRGMQEEDERCIGE